MSEVFGLLGIQMSLNKESVHDIFKKHNEKKDDEITEHEFQNIMFNYNIDQYVRQTKEIIAAVDPRKGKTIQKNDFLYELKIQKEELDKKYSFQKKKFKEHERVIKQILNAIREEKMSIF